MASALSVVKNSSSSLGDLSVLAVQPLPAFIPTSYLSDAKLRINAYRELAEANTPKNWIDRHGRLPHPIQNLLTIARIKAEAASNIITSV